MSATGRKTLDRVLSRAGLFSRMQAQAAITAGRVQVNGHVVRDPGTWIDPVRDKVLCDGASLRAKKKEVWMLHKPAGCVTTARDERDRTTVYSLLPKDLPWLAPVGRLDQDTSGLLLFTNDSDLANAITAPGSGLAKTYEVRCAGALADEALGRLRAGVVLDDGRTQPARVERVAFHDTSTTLRLSITEGKNRQVRRMVEAIGSHVLALHRTHIGPLELGDLPSGELRVLTADELQALRTAISAGRDRPRPRTSRGRAR